MYLSIQETADYLSVTESYINKLIREKKVRFLYDGEQYLLYKDQFKTHLEQLEKYKLLVEELQSEPIPEDLDVKDED